MSWGQDPPERDPWRDPPASGDDDRSERSPSDRPSPSWWDEPATDDSQRDADNLGRDDAAPHGQPLPLAPPSWAGSVDTPSWGDPQQRRQPPPPLSPDQSWGDDPRGDRLQPLNVGDVLDGMFRIAGRHWKAFSLALSVVVVPISLLQGVALGAIMGDQPSLFEQLQGQDPFSTTAPPPTDGIFAAAMGAFALSALLSVFLTPLLYGIATQVGAETYRSGTVEPIEAVKAAGRRYPSLLGASILAAIALFVALLVVGFGAAVLGGLLATTIGEGPGIALAVLIAIGLFVVVVLALARLSLIVPAIIIERANAGSAFTRSNQLVKGATWRVLGKLLLVAIITSLIGGVLTIPFQLGTFLGATTGAVINTIGTILSSLITNALFGVAIVLIYFDRRVRTEGYDLSVLADELEGRNRQQW